MVSHAAMSGGIFISWAADGPGKYETTIIRRGTDLGEDRGDVLKVGYYLGEACKGCPKGTDTKERGLIKRRLKSY